jgi:hypothetical protein
MAEIAKFTKTINPRSVMQIGFLELLNNLENLDG